MVRSRPSQRAANVVYYLNHRLQEIERVRARQADTVAYLRERRRSPCADCGKAYEPHQMDFDHRDSSEKRFRLTAGAAALKGRGELEAEIAKCDVVCANCHRIRTWTRTLERSTLTGTSRYLSRKRAYWQAQAELLNRLRSVPCADCGGRFAPCAMDFDHVDASQKASSVTRMIGRAGTQRLLAEAAKCDIVCANCHRLRTFERRVGVQPARE